MPFLSYNTVPFDSYRNEYRVTFTFFVDTSLNLFYLVITFYREMTFLLIAAFPMKTLKLSRKVQLKFTYVEGDLKEVKTVASLSQVSYSSATRNK